MKLHRQVAQWIPAVGGRRFILTVGAGLVNTILLWFGKLSESGYVTLVLSTVAAYIGANTTQKIKGVKDEPVK
jgi:putative Mn2+ efflux pump MntP